MVPTQKGNGGRRDRGRERYPDRQTDRQIERGRERERERERERGSGCLYTPVGEIILKLESPVAHLVFPGSLLLLSLSGLLCLYLAQVDGTVV